MSHRIGIGRIWHESNSFLAVNTTLEDFQSYADGLLVGDSLFDRPDRSDELTGMFDVFGDHPHVKLVPLIAAAREPSGALTVECCEALTQLLRRQLHIAGELDAICFSLHGAMTGEQIPDLDGHFLQVIRDEIGPDIPLVCALDCHATVTQKMVELSTALTAYRTHPHTDIVETGRRAAHMLDDVLTGRTKPTMHVQKIPLLFPDRGTVTSPLDRLFEQFIAWDSLDRVIGGSLCPAYAFQDVPEQGWAAVAVTDDDEALAQQLTSELANSVWDARRELLPTPLLPPETALRRALEMPGNPILVTDSADNVGAGARGDTTGILSAMMATCRDASGLVLANFTDTQAADLAKSAQVGETITINVAGESNPRYGQPVKVTAEVLCITGGEITDDGRFSAQPTLDIGAMVCLGINSLRLVLTERPVWGPQPSLFRKVGLEPFDAKIVVVKSGIGYKVTYRGVAQGVVDADCPGPGSRNVAHFDFKSVPRPIFPLDVDWDESP